MFTIRAQTQWRPGHQRKMRREIADLVFPIIRGGLDLRERLSAGDIPSDFRQQQSNLRRRLNAMRGPGTEEFFGDEDRNPRPIPRATEMINRRMVDSFLGIRYALTCWLDEIFLDDSCPLREEWDRNKMEVALFFPDGARRAREFWEQARRAETREAGNDALEVFFLCVMLGFRGDLGRDPTRRQEFQDWIDRTKTRLAIAEGTQLPPAAEPVTYHKPLKGRDRFARMVVIGVAVVCVATIAVVLAYSF
jgi:type VI secretion system protein ImpK